MREVSYAEAIREAIEQAMLADDRVFMLGEDIGRYGGAFGVSAGLLEQFGQERIRDTPISELAITGLAIGAALTGMRPIVDIQFSDFLLLAYDQVINQAAKLRYMYGGQVSVPIVIRTPVGSGTGAAAQHSQSLEALTSHIPGLKVVMPSNAYDAKGLLMEAIEDPDPVIFYEHKLLYKHTSKLRAEAYRIPFGNAAVKRLGSDITIVAFSLMVDKALKAAHLVEKKGIQVEVIDPRSLVPLDQDKILESVKKTGRLIIVHEAVKRGGYGGEILSQVVENAFSDLKAAPVRIAGKNTPIPYNSILEKAAVPQVEDIVQAIERLILDS